jgi:molybdopterin molybdotransferase
MPEFLKLISPNDALNRIVNEISWNVGAMEIDTEKSLGLTTASIYSAPHSLPLFRRSTVDGYAVIASDVHGASNSMPSYLQIVGEVAMGSRADFSIARGQCAVIHTGGMLPEFANAVEMLEDTNLAGTEQVEIYRSVAEGENVINIGEDIMQGNTVVDRGVRIRPAEIGGLLAMGITRINVYQKPDVAIISTGDEVVAPDQEPGIGEVRDINSYTLAALVEENFGRPIQYGIVPDDFQVLSEVVKTAHNECDVILVTAGSSASDRDLTSRVFHELGEPGVLVHGINIRPGKPTILANCGNKICVGLPGNPVSALVVASIFIPAIIDRLSGMNKRKVTPIIQAVLTINIPSAAGREDWVPLRFVQDDKDDSGKILVEPIFGKSNLIFTHVKADAILRVASESTGMNAGDEVLVYSLR